MSGGFFVVLLLALASSANAACPIECGCVPYTDAISGNESWIVSCMDLTELPPQWPSDVHPISEIYFSAMDLQEIPSGYFQNFTAVRQIAFRDCTIGGVSGGAFDGVVGHGNNAVILLGYNTIGVVETNAFKGLSNIASVQIFGRSIGIFKPRAFIDSTIGSIIIKGVNIDSTSPDTFGEGLRFYTGFNLRSSLDSFPSELRQVVPTLESIGREGCENRSIESAQLSFVNIYSNTIGELASETFSGVTGLGVLSVHDNDIGLVRSGIYGDMSDVSTVGFTYNRVQGLSSRSFRGLNYVQTFIFHTNDVACAQEEYMGPVAADGVTNEGNMIRPINESDTRPNCQAILQSETTTQMLTETPSTSYVTTMMLESTDSSSTAINGLSSTTEGGSDSAARSSPLAVLIFVLSSFATLCLTGVY